MKKGEITDTKKDLLLDRREENTKKFLYFLSIIIIVLLSGYALYGGRSTDGLATGTIYKKKIADEKTGTLIIDLNGGPVYVTVPRKVYNKVRVGQPFTFNVNDTASQTTGEATTRPLR